MQAIETAITSTDLARNLAVTIDKVRLSRQAINITKGHQTIAQLIPAKQEGLPIAQLANFLSNLPHLSGKHAQSMAADLKIIRESAVLPDDSTWE